MEQFQLIFELIGTVAFAISGAMLGIRKGLDLFGVSMTGMLTTVGGGILRDTILGRTPPAALTDPLEALMAIGVSMLVFLICARLHPHGEHRYADLLLLLADSIGLGVFTANGAAICIAFGCGDRIFLTLVCAVLTGVGGGILRDLCCMERPYVFTKHIYACASLGGGGGVSAALAAWTECGHARVPARHDYPAIVRGALPLEPAAPAGGGSGLTEDAGVVYRKRALRQAVSPVS